MTKIIDGKKISKEIKDEIKQQVAEMKKAGKNIALAVIQVGNNPASTVSVSYTHLDVYKRQVYVLSKSLKKTGPV